jgi:hypothetical protein
MEIASRSVVVFIFLTTPTLRLPLLSCGLLQQFEGLVDRSSHDGRIADLNDRPLYQIRIGYHRFDDVGLGRVVRDAGRGGSAGELDSREPGLFDELRQILDRKRLVKIIDLVVINAVFTKQRRKIAAGRSSRFFVDGYLHKLVTSDEGSFYPNSLVDFHQSWFC